jgi:filamentous hemagglutinin
MVASEQRGQQYIAEQNQLKGAGLFAYDGFDKFNDAATRYQIPNRTVGAVQGVMGSAAAAGALTAGCATVVGCGLGATVAGTSLDYSHAGFQQLVSGNPTPTYSEQVLQSLGLSRTMAALMYGAANLGVTAGDAVLANQAGIKLTQANTLAQASYKDFNPAGVTVTSEVMRTPQARSYQGNSDGQSSVEFE